MARQSEKSEQPGRSDRSEQNGRHDSGGLHLGDVLTEDLKGETRDLMSALGERALFVASDKIGGLTGKAMGLVAHGLGGSGSGSGSDGDGDGDGDSGDSEGSGGSSGGGLGEALTGGGSPVKNLLKAGVSGVKDKIMDKIGGGKKGGGSKSKVTNIIEQIDVGVPVRVAYDQWTQFQDFPKFTKKIETVEQKSDEKVTWKAGIYFSHRTWESTIVEQVPDERIVWRSQGPKGYVDGTVTFHETGPNLTKILVVLEYHPQGLFEKTGNAFRSQKRRARLELNHFDRHVMRTTILEQDDLEGWRGEIRDGEVVLSHEDALEEEQQQESESEDQDDEFRDEGEGEGEDEGEGDDYAGEDDDELDDELDDGYDDQAEDDDEDEYENEYDDQDADEDEDEDDDVEEPDQEDDEDPDAEYDEEWEDEPEEEEEPPRHNGRPARARRREPALSR